MTMDDEWGQTVEGTGEFARPALLDGHLLIVIALGYVPHIQTRFTTAGKKSDAVSCDIIDLDDKDELGRPGKVYRNSNLMQAQLIAQLRPFIGGRKVLGRMGRGTAKNGMNAPWVISDMTADPVCRERADQWKAMNPNFVPSPFSVREPEPYAQPAPAQPAPQQQSNYTQSYRPQPSAAEQYNASLDRMTATSQPASRALDEEERSVVERLRRIREQREREQNPFQDEAPF
jgi:hypothetical protein